ncbi:MAG: SHOCT domain-containing protein [Streptosporangiaceae bacterium]|nr:SHOCT domain-containing protein [Streptosporangiaceae bacterium]
MSGYPLLDIFLSMLWFFLWMLWIFTVVWIVIDIFRSRDIGGWAKAGWFVLVLLLPLIGVTIYLIARGSTMQERQATGYPARVHDGKTGSGSASELARLADLRDQGVINDDEFRRGKDKILYAPGMNAR